MGKTMYLSFTKIICIDWKDLRERGWTEAMRRDLIGKDDGWVSVDHWSNWKGKPIYRLDRIEAI
jgi:hypothetical protein